MSTNHDAAEVIKKILSLLPGVDCGGFGGCGKATCAECAEAIASAKDAASKYGISWRKEKSRADRLMNRSLQLFHHFFPLTLIVGWSR